ncbi:GNAT family N-acetyltransferase [Paenibacillus xylanexedens]|uniref:GNAT family N-acetyltransferase n=1 Tax=Paenibacillus xylanexedens TaxID=528191 RepID=UPI0011A2857B|nr:GNAT family N-acetyltransferase [Paenibacillus xylanexedens]
MEVSIVKNIFLKISEIEPSELRKFIISEIGEKSKDKLYNYLKDLSESYPQFEEWFYNIVIPEVEEKTGEREILLVVSEIEGNPQAILSGIAILKKSKEEKKICTFRVHQDFENKGIGTELFERCFEYLGTRKPIISISEDRIEMFKYHIEKYKFEKTQEISGIYKPNLIEYVFNGYLK